jgi:hypothetical protein
LIVSGRTGVVESQRGDVSGIRWRKQFGGDGINGGLVKGCDGLSGFEGGEGTLEFIHVSKGLGPFSIGRRDCDWLKIDIDVHNIFKQGAEFLGGLVSVPGHVIGTVCMGIQRDNVTFVQ